MPDQTLGLNGLTYSDLRNHDALSQLDAVFLTRLKKQDAALQDRLIAYRQGGLLPPIDVSELLLACAPLVEALIGELFMIEDEVEVLHHKTLAHDPVFVFRKFFVLRRARRRLLKKEEFESFEELDQWLTTTLADKGLDPGDRELAVSKLGQQFLADTETNKDSIEKLVRWCLRALTVPVGQVAVAGWVSFRMPGGVDHANLVPLAPVSGDPVGRVQSPLESLRHRDGFKLTDPRMGARQVQAEINYCIYCHDHDGDFCSKGFPEKKGDPSQGLKVNPLGVTLTGCPLEEKISEMHALKKQGHSIAALAMVMVDNPMCPVTGHRICNDCMKGCIYQKQDPVNIPQIETRVLTDVLELPWGVEIYDLLTRWNPLRARQWLPQTYNGLKVIIAGMGPAGFTLAHHLLMEGFAVVGIEGLKIEPLPQRLIDEPVIHYHELEEELDARVMAGFGGVAEYGITVRWDKNFLKLIYLTLSRRPYFQVFGGVRFGGTVTVEDAWALGFDHFAVAIGAGLPQALPIPNSMARGMRQANDFLMALQLSGAAKANSLANLQIRLPAVVIGGGLTGIDTATEIQTYYLVQIEKTLSRYEKLCADKGVDFVRSEFDEESLTILDEHLAHARAVRSERQRTAANGQQPDLIALLRQWGGVTVVYRRSINDSPAYVRNHEEIIKAMEEGIYYADRLGPEDIRLDRYGHVDTLICRRMQTDATDKPVAGDDTVELPARSILVATGARPNVAYEFEHPGHFAKESGHYQTHRLHNKTMTAIPVAEHCKVAEFGAFTSYEMGDHRVTFLGDVHPVFHGSVVQAVTSGLRTYPKILESLTGKLGQAGDEQEYRKFQADMEERFRTRLLAIKRLTPKVIELTIHAPMAARKFKPGQFFRLASYETRAAVIEQTLLQTEALALAGSRVDIEQGTVSMLVNNYGSSSRICATLKPGEPVSLMGPTGVRTRMDNEAGPETVMIIGDFLAAATIRNTGPALRTNGHRVLYFAQFDTDAEIFYQDELEAAADSVVWCTANGDPISPRRDQDCSASGELTEIIRNYGNKQIVPADATAAIALADIDRILVISDNRLARRLRDACGNGLKPFLEKSPAISCSVNTPMQCMLKGVCSQCLQWQIDPKTGKRSKAVFACSWHNEPIELVDFDNLDDRLRQNRMQEILSRLWLDHILKDTDLPVT